MSVFDEFNSAVPANGKGQQVEAAWWCQEAECFDVVEIAMYYPESGLYVWTCDEGHTNKLKETEIA
jgi:hypothetical protein